MSHAGGAAPQPLIVLLTDFGTRDWFVGVMKGVIKSICPVAELIDLCHEVEPQDIRQAEFILRVSRDYFPHGTIFLCVVDPGVGSDREPVIVHDEAAGHIFVGPNNGLFSFLGDHAQPYVIAAPRESGQLSATFHGRDLFAPAAARLAAGADVSELVSDTTFIVRLESRVHAAGEGEILHFDRFGNAITGIPEGERGVGRTVLLASDMAVPVLRTYADAQYGAALAYWGSAGYLEIAVRNGNARQALGLKLHQRVRLIPR
jgi:S-adenosylmethionine hydrolase